jgi:hypothetical protein
MNARSSNYHANTSSSNYYACSSCWVVGGMMVSCDLFHACNCSVNINERKHRIFLDELVDGCGVGTFNRIYF